MKIEINKDELLAVVKRVLPFVERKTTMPILATLQFVASGDSLTVTGTDLDNALTVTRSARVKTEGSACIPARKLSDVLTKIKTLDDPIVTLSTDEKYYTTLSCGPLTVKLPGMAVSNYPSLLPFPNGKTVELPGPVVAGLIHRVRHAVSREESRYTLNGILLNVTENVVRMVATDGRRLALAEHAGVFTNQLRFLVGVKTIDLVSKLLDAGPVTIAHDDTHHFICASDWQLSARVLTGNFPNYEAVLPKDNAKRVTLPAKSLKESVARIAAFADERSQATKWQLIGGKGIQLSASNTETGDASELIPVSCEDDVTIGLCATHVTDILSTMDKDQTVTFAARSGDAAVLWTPTEPNGFTTKYVLMPMRI